MYTNKAEEMIDFVELLRCQSYDDVYDLKQKIGEERFKVLEEIYEYHRKDEEMIVEGTSIEVCEQEKNIDLSRLQNAEVELIDILRMMMCSTTKDLTGLRLSSKNYYVVETYHDIYDFLKEQQEQIPIMVNIKVTSLVNVK